MLINRRTSTGDGERERERKREREKEREGRVETKKERTRRCVPLKEFINAIPARRCPIKKWPTFPSKLAVKLVIQPWPLLRHVHPISHRELLTFFASFGMPELAIPLAPLGYHRSFFIYAAPVDDLRVP